MREQLPNYGWLSILILIQLACVEKENYEFLPQFSYLEEINTSNRDALNPRLKNYLNVLEANDFCNKPIVQDSTLRIINEAKCQFSKYDYERGDSIYSLFFSQFPINLVLSDEVLLNELTIYIGSTSNHSTSIRNKYIFLENLLQEDYFKSLSNYWKAKIYVAVAGFYRSRNKYDQAFGFSCLAYKLLPAIKKNSNIYYTILYTYILTSVESDKKERATQIVNDLDYSNIEDNFLKRWLLLAKYSFYDSIAPNNIKDITKLIENGPSDPRSKITLAWLILNINPEKSYQLLTEIIEQNNEAQYVSYFANKVLSHYFELKGDLNSATKHSRHSFPKNLEFKDARYLLHLNHYILLLIKKNNNAEVIQDLENYIRIFYNHIEKISTDDARHFGDFIVGSNNKILAFLSKQLTINNSIEIKRLIIQGISLGKYIDLKKSRQIEESATIKDRFNYDIALKKFTQLKLRTNDWSDQIISVDRHSVLTKLLITERRIVNEIKGAQTKNQFLYDSLTLWSNASKTSIIDYTFLDSTLLISSIDGNNFNSTLIDTHGLQKSVNKALSLITSKDSFLLDSQLELLYSRLIKNIPEFNNEAVVISGDQYLEKYPFETLRKEISSDSTIYWIEEKDIYYTSNFERLIQDKEDEIIIEKGLLISFSNDNTIRNSERLDELVYSQKEVKMINETFCRGKCMVNLGGKANYDIDDLDYSDIDFLHIASHGQSGLAPY